MDLKISRLATLVLICGCLFTASKAGCQDLEVSGFNALPNDMTARTLEPIRDANGDLTALVKVVTVESGFIFEGGTLGIVKAEQKAGEWWVYVPPGARTITIRHPRLGVLRNYAYPVAITSGSVYELKLVHGVVETIVREQEILSEFVVIESNPSGADVYLNNEPVGKTPFSSDKAEGRYEWRVEKSLYLPEAGVFDLKAGEKVRLNVELTPDFGSVNIRSTPENGAEILFNGMRMGKSTPATLNDLPTGEHTITLSHNWYETKTEKVTIVAGETIDLELALNPNFAQLNVVAKSDEEVFVNGSSKGKGNWNGRLTPGVYQVELRKPSHETAKKQLTLKSGDQETVVLAPTPILSALKIQSTPMDAKIFLNGTSYGTTPHIVRDLLVGEYELELRKEGFGTLKKRIEVRADETLELNEVLSSNGSVVFTSNVPGTEVYINGNYKGSCPLTISDLTPGSYRYQFRKSGYENEEGNVVVDAGESKQVQADMETLSGSVSLYSSPSGAQVYLEGISKGTTPLVLRGLNGGSYVFEFRKSGYQTRRSRVNIKAGENSSESVDLSPSRSTRVSNQHSYGSMGFFYAPFVSNSRLIGVSATWLNTRGLGGYVDYVGFSLDEEYELLHYSLSAGATVKLFYPLWLYVGGGFATDYDEYYGFYPEGGLHLGLFESITLRFGRIYEWGEFYNRFGIGFDLN